MHGIIIGLERHVGGTWDYRSRYLLEQYEHILLGYVNGMPIAWKVVEPYKFVAQDPRIMDEQLMFFGEEVYEDVLVNATQILLGGEATTLMHFAVSKRIEEIMYKASVLIKEEMQELPEGGRFRVEIHTPPLNPTGVEKLHRQGEYSYRFTSRLVVLDTGGIGKFHFQLMKNGEWKYEELQGNQNVLYGNTLTELIKKLNNYDKKLIRQ